MDHKTPVLNPFGAGFTAIERGYYQQIQARGADTVEEREALQKESEALNAVRYMTVHGAGSKLSLMNGIQNPSKVGTVAIIPVKGVMQKYSSGYWFRTVGTQEIAAHIRAALANPAVSAIVLDFDSGGGQVDGNYTFCDTIAQAKNEKPIYGYVSGMACSAAYQAAAQTEKLFVASPTDYVGSIGVFQVHTDQSGYLEQWGLKVSYIVAEGGEDKIVAPSTAPLSDADRDKVLGQLNDLRATMIDQIETGRGNRIKPTEATYRGGIFTAKEAKKMGLIDGTASLEEVVLKAYRAGEKRKRNGSSVLPTNTLSSMNLNKVLAGLFGKEEKVRFEDPQTLTAEQATEYANNTAALVADAAAAKEDLQTAKADLKDSQDKVANLEGQVTTLQAEVQDLKEKLQAAEDAKEQPAAEAPTAAVETPAAETGTETPEATETPATPAAEAAEATEQPAAVSEDDPYAVLADKLATLTAQVTTLQNQATQAEEAKVKAEQKAENLKEAYTELAAAQGKKLVEQDEDGQEGKAKFARNALPPVSAYSRQLIGG